MPVDGQESQMNEVMEIARFAVADGTQHAEVTTRAHAIDGWLGEQPGFLSRSLVGPDAEGKWTDLVRWRSKEDALRAASAMGDVPELAPFMQMIDPESVEMQHLPVVARLEAG